jgi:hypothetical protein
MLDNSFVHFSWTPHQYSLIASRTCYSRLQIIIECYAQHPLGDYLLLPAIPTLLVHSAFTSIYSPFNTQLYYCCNLYYYFIQYIYSN